MFMLFILYQYKFMKKLLILFVILLNIIFIAKAEDVTDFQIEGMSVGDSLLDYYSEKEILKKINSSNTFFYNKDYMSISLSYKTGKFKKYDDVGVVLKQKDKQYKIYSLEGTLVEDGTKENCYKKQNSIANDIGKIIDPKYAMDEWFVEKKRLRPHQKSVRYLNFKSSSNRQPFSIICYEYHKEKYTTLYVVVDSEVFDIYLDTYR